MKMGKRKIKISLSDTDSIQRAIDEIQEYRKDLMTNISIFLDNLISEGIVVAKAQVATAPSEYRDRVTVESNPVFRTGYIYTGVIRLQGDQALFIEFSAGEKYGTDHFDPLPNNPSYGSGYGKGTYNPESDNWKNPDGWRYGKGGSQHTYGTPAVAPMYNADKKMRDILMDAAKKVWG